jgi:hypothetical protein
MSRTGSIASPSVIRTRRGFAAKAVQSNDFDTLFNQNPLTEEEKQARDKESKEKLAEKYARNKLSKIDDPFHIAQAVSAALREGKFENALLLTEKASRTMDVVVSWNALLGFQLERGQVKAAFKLFNNVSKPCPVLSISRPTLPLTLGTQMKKRGQKPNVRTFTTIFDGLSNCPNKQLAVNEAVKQYNTLVQDDRLDANIIHTNAVLKLCARAHDLDQMLLIANTLDNSTRAADATTYTILLEGIRHKVLAEVKDMDPHESERYRKDMADKAMVLWSEVLRKWKAGRLRVDERLVVAMARTYPFQEERNIRPEDNKILDLLEEMMDVPNYAKHPDWDKEEAKRRSAESFDPQDDKTKKPTKAVGAAKTTSGIKAVPTTRTLGLILEVIGASRRSSLAIKYWNKLVDDFNVHPDHDNYFRMLVLLKTTKSSGHIVWLLKHSHGSVLNAGHINIALEACINDNINTNSVGNAQDVMKRASEVLPANHPELMKLHRMYLRVALVSHHTFRQQSMRGEDEAARTAYGRQILAALEYLWEPYQKLHKQWFKTAPESAISNEAAANIRAASKTQESPQKQRLTTKLAPLSQGELRNMQREVIALARNMYASYNKLRTEKMLPEEELQPVLWRAAKLNREVQYFYSDRGEFEPNLPPQDYAKRESMRRGRLSGTASAKALPASDKHFEAKQRSSAGHEQEMSADDSIAAEADELAREIAPVDQDIASDIPRVGAEFVWSTRSPMGSKKISARTNTRRQSDVRTDRRRKLSPASRRREGRGLQDKFFASKA